MQYKTESRTTVKRCCIDKLNYIYILQRWVINVYPPISLAFGSRKCPSILNNVQDYNTLSKC